MGVRDKKNDFIGRIAAILNPFHEKIYGVRAGFFGLLETVNDKQVISILFDAAKSFLKENRCTQMIGPVNFTTNDESGILVDGFDHDAAFLCAYSKKYYPELLEYCGLRKAVDMLAYTGTVEHIYPEKFDRVIKRIESNPGLLIRTFDKKRKLHDTKIICDLYNQCFKEVWGYVPLTIDEANDMSKKFLTFYDRELIWLAYVNGIPAGFILGLPDINQVLKFLNGKLSPFGIARFYMKKNNLDSIRILAMGVHPSFRNIGLETLLIKKIHQRMKEKIYTTAELSFIMETNLRMRRVLENLGFKAYKRYRIYKTDI